MRLGTVFVVICMVVIAASVGAAVHLAFGFGGSESAIIGLAVLAVLGVYHYFSSRTRLQKEGPQKIADQAGGDVYLARQMGDLNRRVTKLESRLDQSVDRARAVTDPIAFEISELGALVRELAETVSAHQSTLTKLDRQSAPGDRPLVPSGLPAEAFSGKSVPIFAGAFQDTNLPAPVSREASAPVRTEPTAAVVEAAAQPDPDTEALASIRAAIDAGRIDLYLQPIVTLPQRKVRYYEAVSRLRTDRGELLPAADFVAHAEAGGLMPKIDNLVAFHCVQLVRRLLLKNRDVGLFCNLSSLTLSDPIFPQMLEFLEANRAIAPSLVLEFTQASVRGMGPIEHESLAALAERGFRFSLDNVVDLRIEPRELANRNFRFIKIPANFLLNRSVAQTDIHPADLSDLVGRFGIDLIADKIESEGSAVDLLDCDVRYGQGFLFSPPRPVRAEALQGVADRTEPITRETAEEPAPAIRLADRPISSASPPEPTKTEPRSAGLAQLARGIVSRG
jgi:cyclic-di-GMP phosphodiesterase TipF (flagellum assembly factor)